jgi:Asp/Glu/hydantoin racemase
MFTVGAIYTGPAIVDTLSAVFEEIMPGDRLINLVDGALIQDVIAEGSVTTGHAKRMMHLYMTAVDAGVDVILNTCSSVGDVVAPAQWFVPVPILKIDAPMAIAAIGKGKRIAVLATLPTTLAPTVRLVKSEAAQAGKEVEIVEGLAEGAFDALLSGDPGRHDTILMETALRAAGSADAVVLAQGSMARMAESIAKDSGKPVFSSLQSGVESVRAFKESR